MATSIPVLCKNPDCGEVFLSDFAIATSPGASISFEGCVTGSCPKCGSVGMITSGTYLGVGLQTATFIPQSAADRYIFEKTLVLIRQALRSNTPSKDFEQTALEELPQLSAL